MLLLQYLGRGGEPRCRAAAERVRRQQLPGGGWAIYPGGPPEVSASVEAYFVLKLTGDSPDAEHMARARQVILGLGGARAVNSYTKVFLALLGQLDWEECPAIPPELLLLPEWAYLNLYEMSSWARALVVPLSILWSHRPVRPVPPHLGIEELFAARLRKAAAPRRGLPSRADLWRAFFLGLDRGLKGVERYGGFKRVRGRALAKASSWIIERLGRSDGLGAIFPSIVYSVFALVTLGYPEGHPLVRQQLTELEKLELPQGEELRLQPCKSPVWDTALALNALGLSLAADDPRLIRAARWIASKEVRAAGDWRKHNPKGPVGGWYFEYANEFYPDCDDTAQVLTALSRLSFPASSRAQFEAVERRALDWLLSMQNADGGWAAFNRECTKQVLSYFPFADHNAMLDPSCPDITGRVLDCLAHEGLGPTHPAVRRGVKYLLGAQEPDGTWYGRWGCNYVYGTWLALAGLEAAGEDLSQERYQRAAHWLHERQNPDGGWGESLRSYDDPLLKGLGASTAAQTAWALMGLWASGDRDSSFFARGVDYLLRTQGEDGTWHDQPWTGTGFPRVFYLRYDLYDDYFPLQALSTFLPRQAAP